ncbi:MAG: PAS domain-containing protein [Rhizomicrobium sp.]
MLSVGLCGIAAGVSLLADEGIAADESYLHLALFVSSAVAVGFLVQDSQRPRALRREQHELDEIVENIPGMAWRAGVDGRLTGMNAAFRKYLEVAGAGSFRSREAIHPEDAAQVIDLWKRSLETGAEFHSTYRIRGADGAYRWFRAAARPQFDRKGGMAGWYGTLVDVDDQKLTEQALRASEVALRSILDNIPG